MATDANGWSRGRGSRWTLIPWGGAACLLLLPFVAMRFTSEVNWSSGDFILMGAMLGLACALVETVVRLSGSWAYRLAACAAIGSAFLIIWANLAVGIVGSENNPANRSFFAALGVGIVGALLARFRAKGMARAMAATAGAIGIAFILAVSSATGTQCQPLARVDRDPRHHLAVLAFGLAFPTGCAGTDNGQRLKKKAVRPGAPRLLFPAIFRKLTRRLPAVPAR
jgi:hypothetical protein